MTYPGSVEVKSSDFALHASDCEKEKCVENLTSQNLLAWKFLFFLLGMVGVKRK